VLELNEKGKYSAQP